MTGNNGKQPAIVGTVHIDMMDDGGIRVRNFPQRYIEALSVMQAATAIVCNFFMEKALRGELGGQKIIRPGLGIDLNALKGGK